MTEIEALNFINERIALIKKHYEDIAEYREALEMSAKALNKQIPKKPTKNDYDPGIYYYCPVCGVDATTCSYCPHCGQRIDWADKG